MHRNRIAGPQLTIVDSLFSITITTHMSEVTQ